MYTAGSTCYEHRGCTVDPVRAGGESVPPCRRPGFPSIVSSWPTSRCDRERSCGPASAEVPPRTGGMAIPDMGPANGQELVYRTTMDARMVAFGQHILHLDKRHYPAPMKPYHPVSTGFNQTKITISALMIRAGHSLIIRANTRSIGHKSKWRPPTPQTPIATSPSHSLHRGCANSIS